MTQDPMVVQRCETGKSQEDYGRCVNYMDPSVLDVRRMLVVVYSSGR